MKLKVTLFLMFSCLALSGATLRDGIAATTIDGVASAASVDGVTISGGGGPTLFLDETFDATGYDDGDWVEQTPGATYDEDYTTSPAPLEGTQSVRMNLTSTLYLRNTFSAQTEIYGKVIFNAANIGGIPQIFLFTGSSQGEIRLRNISGSNRLQITNGSNSQDGTTTVISLNTTYYMWFYWKKGTGSDGITRVFISTSNSKPGSPEVEITNGNSTGNVSEFYLQGSNPSDVIWDRVQLSATGYPTP